MDPTAAFPIQTLIHHPSPMLHPDMARTGNGRAAWYEKVASGPCTWRHSKL